MRLLAALLVSAALLAICAPAHADEPSAERVTWHFEKEGVRHAIEVTHLDEALRAALQAQLEAQGWRRMSEPLVAGPGQEAAPDAPPPSLEQDLRELVRRRGRLPPDFRPHALRRPAEAPRAGPLARFTGELILAYFADREDPAKARAWEALLRQVAESLTTTHPEAPGGGLQWLRVEPGLELAEGDPRRAVHAAARRLLERAVAKQTASASPPPSRTDIGALPRAPRPPQAPAAPRPAWDRPQLLGGARALLTRAREAPDTPILRLVHVPEDSTAYAAGLRSGDSIVAIDGRGVDPSGFARAVRAFREGGQLTLELVRTDDERETLRLLLEKE